MSFAQTVLLGALAGFTIYIGLPVGRMRLLGSRSRVALAMFAVGVLAFIFVDVLSNGLVDRRHAVQGYKHPSVSLAYVVWLVVLLGGRVRRRQRRAGDDPAADAPARGAAATDRGRRRGRRRCPA